MADLAFDIIILAVVILGGRALLEIFMDTTNVKKKFMAAIGLFLIYTYVLIAFLHYLHFEVFRSVEYTEAYFKNDIAGILIMNFAVLFISVCCFFMRNKRKINEMDKMKLKDM